MKITVRSCKLLVVALAIVVLIDFALWEWLLPDHRTVAQIGNIFSVWAAVMYAGSVFIYLAVKSSE